MSERPGDAVPREPHGLLDEPILARQWVVRRLQRALLVERWGGPCRRGLSRLSGDAGSALEDQSAASEHRRGKLVEMIGALGATPYSDTGLAGPVGRFSGSLVAFVSRRGARSLARWLSEHTLSEYNALVALVEDLRGIDEGHQRAIEELCRSARSDAEWWLREPDDAA